jgi:4'-phosphopantetheinyl transferase
MVIDMIIYIIKNPSLKDYKQILLNDYCQNNSININIEILKNKLGKPYIKDNPFYFNISHSEDYYIMAISHQNIGIDIQKHVLLKPKIINRFTLEEKDYINNDIIKFYDLWCKKESYAKYLGISIFHTLNINLINNPKDCLLKQIHVDNNYSCYVCIKKDEDILLKYWEEEK